MAANFFRDHLLVLFPCFLSIFFDKIIVARSGKIFLSTIKEKRVFVGYCFEFTNPSEQGLKFGHPMSNKCMLCVTTKTQMLFRQNFLDGIRAGDVTLAFRRWRRPSVKTGSTLLTPAGELSIRTVEVVEQDQISKADSLRAGYESLDDLLLELQSRPEGDIYKIELGSLRPDPRIALREKPVSGDELEDLLNRLKRLDSRSQSGPWTFSTLEILNMNPGVRAGDLCKMADQEKEKFKLNVRKLKNLGLTVSLGTGYRLSIRGKALLDTKIEKGGRNDT